MSIKRLRLSLKRVLLRLFPRRLHTPPASARTDVKRLDAEQRRELARNLRRMLRPDAA